MPDPRERPLRFRPRGVSDTVDGTNSPPGACMSLANLIFDPGTPGILQCRPANLKLSSFSGFSTPAVVSAAYQLSGIIYGMIGSAHFSGHDEPFAYNISSNTFLTLQGAVSANTPATQATSGAWTPPDMAVTGQQIMVAHPGFNFAGGFAFGFFDISNFSDVTVVNTTSASNVLTGNPNILGLMPGYLITASGVATGTYVTGYAPVIITTTCTTHSNTTLDSILSTAGMAVGQTVAGLGIPPATTITAVNSINQITISNAATTSVASTAITVAGATITMSANASASNSQESATIAGGTPASPLWAAGNTTGETQLAGVASCVGSFNNRTFFGQGNNLILTDTLSLNVSNVNGVQVLTVGDSTPIIAIGNLPEYQSTGGIIQALVIFKANYIQQITGDPVTSNLLQQTMSTSVGTSAPRSVVAYPDGLFFMATDGIRKINLLGQVSEPDDDLALPFIYAVTPSRVAAAYNSNIYRICTQNDAPNTVATPYQGYYFDLRRKAWTGPHSFRDDLLVAYANDFIAFNNAIPATMWQSFTVQDHNNQGNTFTENGTPLTWSYITSPMSEQDNMYANCAVRSTLDISLPSNGATYLFQGSDAALGAEALAELMAPSSVAIWDAFNWGAADWGAAQLGLTPQIIPWTKPLIFNKLVLQAQGVSASNLALGAWYIGFEKLNYMMEH